MTVIGGHCVVKDGRVITGCAMTAEGATRAARVENGEPYVLVPLSEFSGSPVTPPVVDAEGRCLCYYGRTCPCQATDDETD